MRILGIDVGIKNLALCILETSPDLDHSTIVFWDLIKCTEDSENIKALTITQCVQKVASALRRLRIDFDVIAVEQQPCGGSGAVAAANTKMRCVQASIETWAAFRGVPAYAVAARSKIPDLPKDTKYGDRKKIAVQKVRCAPQLSSTTAESPWRVFLDSHPKKDDLADAFLIASVHMEREKISRKKYLRKIKSVSSAAARQAKKRRRLD